jgi:DNA-binding NtrC family response regulator
MSDIASRINKSNRAKSSENIDSTLEKKKQDGLYHTRLDRQNYRTILIVDDEPDITYTLKLALENNNEQYKVSTYNNPLTLLSEFMPNVCDLLLVDINMPFMDGFELCKRILEIDLNVRICFMSTGEVNLSALRDVYPKIGVGCFIKKPILIKNLIKMVEEELE